MSPTIRLSVIALVVGLYSGCHRRNSPPAEEKIPSAPVKWEGIRQLILEEWTDLVGTAEPLPDHAARVTAPVEGRVLSVLTGAAGKPIAEGQLVEAGDVLVRLDDALLRVIHYEAVATKKVLVAEKEAADFAVKQADLEMKRLNELKKTQEGRGPGGVQLVGPIDVEKAVVALDAALAHARADDVKLAAADDKIASLDRLLKLYALTAPRKGRLGRLQVVVGQTLASGAAVAEVIDVEDEINVLCYVPESEAKKLQVGQPAHLGGIEREATDNGPEGKVEFIADQVEADTGLVAVKVRFPNRDLKLRANAVVRLRVLTQPGKACWCIPETALIEDHDPPNVVIVEEVESNTPAFVKKDPTFTARRMWATIGVRDRVKGQVEVLLLKDADDVKDPDKKWKGALETVVVVFEKGQGLQTGDAIKSKADED